MSFTKRCTVSAYVGMRTKTWMFMKLTAVLLLAACLQVSASGNAQRISFSLTNASLKKVFREIEKQSGYQFFYKERLLKDAPTVTIQVSNASLENVMELCLKNQALT